MQNLYVFVLKSGALSSTFSSSLLKDVSFPLSCPGYNSVLPGLESGRSARSINTDFGAVFLRYHKPRPIRIATIKIAEATETPIITFVLSIPKIVGCSSGCGSGCGSFGVGTGTGCGVGVGVGVGVTCGVGVGSMTGTGCGTGLGVGAWGSGVGWIG